MEPLTELPANPSIEQLRRYEGTLYAKNHSVKAVSCNTKEHKFLLAPSGADGDVQILPKRCLDEAGFQKVVYKGQVSISPNLGDEAMAGSIRLDAERDQQLADIAAMTEENSSAKDLVEVSCAVCGETVFQPQGDVTALVAPTCPVHKNRESDFFGTEVQNSDGTTRVVFNPLPNRS